jgi:adenosine 3'-phospho 5'-phosphosulfate transporter B3
LSCRATRTRVFVNTHHHTHFHAPHHRAFNALQFLPGFNFGWYLTFWELLAFTGFAMLERKSTAPAGTKLLDHKIPLSKHMLVALAMTASRGLTNVSMQYLNYPTQVIFKSLKLLTVMIGSVFMLQKTYHWLEYFSAFLLSLSAIFFALGDSSASPSYNTFGFIVVILSLVADAVHSNSQDLVMRRYAASTQETMLFTNMLAAGCTFVVIVFNGELMPAFAYCAERPFAYVIMIGRALVIYSGVLCFLTMIKAFGIVTATTVTTVRKILTILLSFIVFPKPFSMSYVYGALIFGAGLAINIKMALLKVAKKPKPEGADDAKPLLPTSQQSRK